MRTLVYSLAFLAIAAPAAAQELVDGELRQGYYAGVSFSAGVGSTDDSDIGDLGSGLDAGARIRFGQMFSPNWGAGLLLLGGTNTTTISTVSVVRWG